MTNPDHSDNQAPPADARPAPTRRRRPFGGHVAGTISRLQQRHLDRSPTAAALLAQLRTAVTAAPGSQYSVLELTAVPDQWLASQPDRDPTDTELAKHAALALYALHQQSVYDKPMHVDGPGFGTAISLLSRETTSSEAVRRRFTALGTATTYSATLHHLRSLVHQLRGYKIGFDYGLLADDLVTLLGPAGHERVRAIWGRDFYRHLPTAESDATNPTPSATNRTTVPETSDPTDKERP